MLGMWGAAIGPLLLPRAKAGSAQLASTLRGWTSASRWCAQDGRSRIGSSRWTTLRMRKPLVRRGKACGRPRSPSRGSGGERKGDEPGQTVEPADISIDGILAGPKGYAAYTKQERD